jgi:hypothetical protein
MGRRAEDGDQGQREIHDKKRIDSYLAEGALSLSMKGGGSYASDIWVKVASECRPRASIIRKLEG